jgi:hypothetical protein
MEQYKLENAAEIAEREAAKPPASVFWKLFLVFWLVRIACGPFALYIASDNKLVSIESYGYAFLAGVFSVLWIAILALLISWPVNAIRRGRWRKQQVNRPAS